MEKRHVGTVAIVTVLAGVAVVGAVGGNYLANRDDRAATDRTVDAGRTPDADAPTGGPGATGGPDSAAPSTKPPAGSSTSTAPSAPPGDGQPRTYRLDRVFYDQASMTVTLVNAEVTGSKLRLNVRYRNGSVVPWTLNCPTAAEDRESAQLTLADGRTVQAESTYCATTRPGESFDLAPGRELTSWAVFPVVPQVGSSFELSWYDFPASDLQLR
ncbi:hypothetical protein [Micromonospora cathayae]|uniref:DUF4352 domain-containing protein n=1 Tax=Micromonospora cathayae TaxID=3028804 RepID=A0ABY7ZPX2_9ACTN|nr:hypothetical protein [Micromonospora sp. HUAS 3]WDZ84913.1 hypothetical protein PVK37_00065 [Micromonospora sp. HUAS 3]